MAAQGVRFPAAVSPAPITLPSHTSIMTGYFPRRHGVRDNGQVVPAAPPTLAEAVQKAGYATAAFVSGFPLASQFGLDRGFGHYDDGFVRGSGQLLERPAEETTTAALAWVKAAREPWMLWVHYYDPHDPYDPPAKFRRSGPRGAYDGEVTYVDGAIGRLRANLPVAATASLLTVFAADHGESLGEHGENTHGYFIYDSTLLVPLVFHFPRRLAPREGKEARLVDVAPTILDLLGLPSLPATDGVSLVPTLEGREQEVPAAYLETQRPWISYGWSPLSAVRRSSLHPSRSSMICVRTPASCSTGSMTIGLELVSCRRSFAKWKPCPRRTPKRLQIRRAWPACAPWAMPEREGKAGLALPGAWRTPKTASPCGISWEKRKKRWPLET